MKTEKIFYPTEIIQPRKKQEISTHTANTRPSSHNKAMIMASLLALSSLAQADVVKNQQPIDPKDLSFESTSEFERNWFKNYVAKYSELKNYARVDRNTLRTVNEADAVLDHIIDDNNVHDVVHLGYTVNGNLYPNGRKVPLKEQQYSDYETYLKEKAAADTIKNIETGAIVAIPMLYLLFLIIQRNTSGTKKRENKRIMPRLQTSEHSPKNKFIDIQQVYGVTTPKSKK